MKYHLAIILAILLIAALPGCGIKQQAMETVVTAEWAAETIETKAWTDTTGEEPTANLYIHESMCP